MKFALNIILVALLAAFGGAVSSEQKPVIVSYPKDTPQSVLDSAMAAIKQAGGIITHEYSLIKGFAAKATEEALETVQALGGNHAVTIEHDQTITINNQATAST